MCHIFSQFCMKANIRFTQSILAWRMVRLRCFFPLVSRGKRGVLPDSIGMLHFLSFLLLHSHGWVLNAHILGPKPPPLIAFKLHLPRVHKSGGAAIYMWIKVRSNSKSNSLLCLCLMPMLYIAVYQLVY